MRRRVSLAQRLDDLPVKLEQRDITVAGRGITYGLLTPRTPPPPGGYPLIVGLHYATSQEPGLSPYFGIGFVGLMVLPALQDLGAVIIAPDAPEASWAHAASEESVRAIVEVVRKEQKLDAGRTLVTGFSMGGQGAWFFAATHAELFKAAIPMSALPRVSRVQTPADVKAAQAALDTGSDWAMSLVKTPLYVISSRADQTVPFDAVERAVKTVEARGGTITFAPVDDVPHHLV